MTVLIPNTPPNFRGTRKFMGPAWLTSTGESELLGYALDAPVDDFVERLRRGLLAHFPQNDPTGATTAPDDALSAMGRDRRIVRGINESAVAYARRLVRWLDDWATAGNPFALMKQLAAYTGAGTAFRTVDVRGNWYSLSTAGAASVAVNVGNWDWDGDPYALNKWSRFWVVIYPNGLWSASPTYGTAGVVYGMPGATIGTTATADQVASVRGIVRDWKPGGTFCSNIIIAFDSASFDPTHARDGVGLPNGTWGGWATYSGGAVVPARLATARYWDGT